MTPEEVAASIDERRRDWERRKGIKLLSEDPMVAAKRRRRTIARLTRMGKEQVEDEG
jgi:hypothetical protein